MEHTRGALSRICLLPGKHMLEDLHGEGGTGMAEEFVHKRMPLFFLGRGSHPEFAGARFVHVGEHSGLTVAKAAIVNICRLAAWARGSMLTT